MSATVLQTLQPIEGGCLPVIFDIEVHRSEARLEPRLPYAGLDGTDKWHGVAQFDGIVIPQRILESIRQIHA